MVDALGEPAIREKLATQLMEPMPTTPAQFRAKIDADLARWAPVIKAIDSRSTRACSRDGIRRGPSTAVTHGRLFGGRRVDSAIARHVDAVMPSVSEIRSSRGQIVPLRRVGNVDQMILRGQTTQETQ